MAPKVQNRPSRAARPKTMPPPAPQSAVIIASCIPSIIAMVLLDRPKDAAARRLGLLAEDIVNHFEHAHRPLVCKAVIDRLALTTRPHKPLGSQPRKLLRHGGLSRRQQLFQFGHGFFATGQMTENHQPALMTDRLEEVRSVTRILHHARDVFVAHVFRNDRQGHDVVLHQIGVSWPSAWPASWQASRAPGAAFVTLVACARITPRPRSREWRSLLGARSASGPEGTRKTRHPHILRCGQVRAPPRQAQRLA